jgi:hypothetical protein
MYGNVVMGMIVSTLKLHCRLVVIAVALTMTVQSGFEFCGVCTHVHQRAVLSSDSSHLSRITQFTYLVKDS